MNTKILKSLTVVLMLAVLGGCENKAASRSDNPEIRAVLEKYFGGAADAASRLKVMNLISDLTARDLGGYHAVLAVHAEGSIEAEKMQMLRAFTANGGAERALTYTRTLAGLD